MIKELGLILLISLFTSSTLVFGGEVTKRVCVIGFERRDFPISLSLNKIFKDAEDIHLITEAGPLDLEQCLKDDFEEIILVTHSFLVDGDKNRVTIGYFKEIIGDSRETFIQTQKKLVKERLEEINSKKGIEKLKTSFERKRLLRLLTRINETPADQALYAETQILFSRFFEKIYKLLLSKKNEDSLKLKKFRLLTCSSDLILKKYPFFLGLVELGVELDVAPSNRIMSFLKGHQVTSLNRRWLKESLL